MNVLAIGTHFDDIELGCGGSLCRHVFNDDTMKPVLGNVGSEYEQH